MHLMLVITEIFAPDSPSLSRSLTYSDDHLHGFALTVCTLYVCILVDLCL